MLAAVGARGAEDLVDPGQLEEAIDHRRQFRPDLCTRLRTPTGRATAPLGGCGLTLLCIAEDPDARMRDIAADVQITERAAQRIVADLIGAGYLRRERVGRRNRYTIPSGLPVSLPPQRDVDLNSLLNVLLPTASSVERKRARPRATASA